MLKEFTTWLNWLSVQPFLGRVIDLATVIILSFTATEALRARRASNQSNELKLLPVLGIYFRKTNGREEFVLENHGEGIAYNIRIQTWRLILTDTQEVAELKMSIRGTNILPHGKQVTISTEVKVNNKTAGSSEFMTFALKNMGVENSIEFRNALGHKYRTKIRTKDDDVEIVTPPYRVGLFKNSLFWVRFSLLSEISLWRRRIIWKFQKPHIQWI